MSSFWDYSFGDEQEQDNYYDSYGDYYSSNHSDDAASSPFPSSPLLDDFQRFLAGKAKGDEEVESLDYSVLSVGVMTLGLILVVEIGRHHIDHKAHGRPFFQAVLDNVYSELATLGLVEFFLFVLMKYYKNINYQRKEVFGDVHFCIFYTAIFNAFQSAITAFVVMRASVKQWVATEHLELDHYVEIREAFDRVEKEVMGANLLMKYNPFSPLRSRYLKLLMQVRFHELRLHFLEFNDLPLQFKVSDYLKRCELRLLISLVQISALAWILLTGGLNLIYFWMGMVAYRTSSGKVIGWYMTGIFYSMLFSFIIFTVILYYKMKGTFQEILSMKYLKQCDRETEREAGIDRQKSLFWLGKPTLVISLIQFMQFGYALALSVVIMYWDEFKGLHPGWYLLTTCVCYGIFVHVLSLVFPQYTLCTSLGHLVNQKNLQETVAKYRLEDEQRRLRRKKAAMHYNIDNNASAGLLMFDDSSDSSEIKFDRSNNMDGTDNTLIGSEVGGGSFGGSSGSLGLGKDSAAGELSSSSGDSEIRSMPPSSKPANSVSSRELLAALVKMDTAKLRENIPEETREKLTSREEKAASTRKQRMMSMRQLSESVARLPTLGKHPWDKDDIDETSASLSTDDPNADAAAKRDARAKRLANRRANRKKAVTASAVIHSWRNINDSIADDDAKTATAKRPSSSPMKPIEEKGPLTGEPKWDKQSLKRRSSRKKASSDPDVVKAWTDSSGPPSSSEDDKIADGNVEAPMPGVQSRRQRRKSLSASTVVKSWRDFSADGGAGEEKLEEQEKAGLQSIRSHDDMEIRIKSPAVDLNVSDLLENKSEVQPQDPTLAAKTAAEEAQATQAARVAERRRNRKRAISAPSIIETWQHLSADEAGEETKKGQDKKDSNAVAPALDHPGSPPAKPTRFGVDVAELTVSDLLERSSQDIGGTVAAVDISGVPSVDTDPQVAVTKPSSDDAPAEHVAQRKEFGSEPMSQDVGPMVVDMSGFVLGSVDPGNSAPSGSGGINQNTEKDENDDHDDHHTVDTGKSVGEQSDGLSDVDIDDDLRLHLRPAVHRAEEDEKTHWSQHLTKEGLTKDLRAFFLGENYATCSHVFGTLVVFFLIGERVEKMNAVTGFYDPSEITWEFNLGSSYWMQIAWYCFFLLTDATALALFGHPTAPTPERKIAVSALMDFMISGTCFILLLVAEAQRCCDKDLHEVRYLADETGFGSDFVQAYDGTYSECCGKWGSRTYGGLGNIEPFTSLIALRLLRFFVAGLLVNKFFSAKSQPNTDDSTEEENESGDNLHKHHDSHDHDHGHGMGDHVGSALELWEQAIGKYPEIVQKYGQFSSELFKTMLGLEIIVESKPMSIANEEEDNGANLLTEDNFKAAQQRKEPKQSTIKLVSKQYIHLPAEVQQIIIAGRLGVPVKLKSENLMGHHGSSSELPTLMEDAEVHHKSTTDPLEFEVDTDKLAKEEEVDSMYTDKLEEEGDSMFLDPNARLVRSMRRCHRRLLPLLNEWVTVDVAVTQFEIVYFEVTESEDPDEPHDLRNVRENGKLALQATKGGKGLRLRDIAAGRKVVGHFDLEGVTEVHVERDLPLTEADSNEDHFYPDKEVELGAVSQLPSEFWCDGSNTKANTSLSRDLRWSKTKEDRLTIKTRFHDTLVLRFFSDLDEMEGHKDDHVPTIEGGSTLKKIVAYQWAQTIVHSCGQEQLVGQLLPHYGEGAGELQDYIELAHYHDDEFREHHKKVNGNHRRKGSDMIGFMTAQSLESSSFRKSGPQRASSFDKKAEANPKSFRRSNSSPGPAAPSGERRTLNRSASSGDHDSSQGAEEKYSKAEIQETAINLASEDFNEIV